ncbi:MAG: DUF2268 domain-containing putative Zn-dependent protease [Candidatus Saccharimonadales bacterium]
MIKVSYVEISQKDKSRIEVALPIWLQEVRELLPQVPEVIEVIFDNQYLIKITGTGGFALDKDKIALAFDPAFTNKNLQFNNLRGSFYHECFHLVQGWVGGVAGGEISAIEDALMEGSATVFERERTGTKPPWSDYSDIKNIDEKLATIKELGANYDWQKWKFYDPETNTRWILYKVGVYLTEKILDNNPELTIEDVAGMKVAGMLDAAD